MKQLKTDISRILLIVFFSACFQTAATWAVPPELLTDVIGENTITPIFLTPKERQFLKDHPKIRIGTDHGWDPFVIQRQDGTLAGFEIDLMQIFSRMTGADFQIVTDRWSTIQEMAKARTIDGLADSTVNKERKPFFNFTVSYVQLYPVFVVRSDSALNISSINDFSGKTVSILKGNVFNRSLLKEYPGITMIEAPSERDAIKLTVEGKTDACLIAANTFNTHYKVFSNIIKIGYIEPSRPLDLVYSIRKDWPELISILNKAISSIPRATYDRLFYKWFNLDPIQRVKQLNEINTVIVDNYAPYSFLNEHGEPDGYIVDLITAVAAEMGMGLTIRTEVWDNALIKLLKNQINVLPLMAYSEERDIQYDFSQTHTVTYDAFFNRKKDPRIKKPEDLMNKRIIVMKNDRSHDYLNNLSFITDDQFVFENNPVEALRQLSSGKGDVAVMPKLIGLQILKKHNLQEIDPSPQIIQDYSRVFCFAVKEGDAALVKKLENGLQLIKESGTFETIHDKWLGVYDPYSNAVKYFLWIILAFFLVTCALFLWTYTLKRQVTQRTKKLQIEINDRKRAEKTLSRERDSLQKALLEINTLKGLLPVCATCKKIRDDKGDWKQMEEYISRRSEAEFSHSICPECAEEYYPDFDIYEDSEK